MSSLTQPARFMNNNFLNDGVLVSTTSEASGFPSSNIYQPLRAKSWRGAGYFVITSSNNKFYFHDGVARAGTIPPANYTAAGLIAAFNAAALATGTGMGVRLEISPSGLFSITFDPPSLSLYLSVTTNAIWSTLGYVGTTNRYRSGLARLAFLADVIQCHTYEQITAHMGIPMLPSFFAIIDAIDAPMTIGQTAIVTLMANNVDAWSAPPVSIAMTRHDSGYFAFIDSQITSPSYEYWAIRMVDPHNAIGPSGARIGHAYIGDHVTLTSANVGIGWTKTYVDKSDVLTSFNGTRYVNRRPKYRAFRGLGMANVDGAAERRILEQTLYDAGVDNSFYVSLDPQLRVSAELQEMTLYCHQVNDIPVRHVIRDIYSIEIDLEESV